jgi:MFS family permease
LGDEGVDLKRSFAVLSVALFTSMLGLGVVSPLMSIYAESLGASGIWLGAIFSGFSLSRALVMPVVGQLSDRLGRRKVFLTVGMLAYAVTSIGYVLSRTVVHLILARFLQGFASGTVLPIAMAYVGDITPKGQEGTYTGGINVARFLGWACGPLLGGYLMELYDIAVPFLIMGGFALLAMVLVLLILPEHPVEATNRHAVSYRRVLRDRTIRGVVVYRAINAVGTGNMFSFLPLLAVELGVTTGEIGLLLSSRIFVMSLLQGPFGKLADRYRKVTLILLSGIGSAVLLLLVPYARNFLDLLAIGLLLGSDWAVLMPATTALAAEYGRTYGMASVMSLVNFGMSLGMVVGPLVAGYVLDLVGIHAIFLFGGITALFGAALFHVLVR